MSAMNTETISREALSLPVRVRVELAELAERPLCRLDSFSESEIEQLWLQEASRRAAEIDSGASPLIPAYVVRLETQALLKQVR